MTAVLLFVIWANNETYYFEPGPEADNPSILLNYLRFCPQLLFSASSRYHWDYLLIEKKKEIRNLTNNMAIMSHDKHHEQSALIVNELPHNIPKWQWTVLLHIFKINFTHLTQIWNIQSVYIKYKKYSTDCHRNLFQHSYTLFSLFRKLARINWKKLKVNKKIRKLCK